MPRYRKNNKNKQKNKNKNINNKNNHETKEYKDKFENGDLVETVDLNLNSNNNRELNLLCTEKESNSNCDDISQSENINVETDSAANEELGLIHKKKDCDLDNIEKNYQVTINDIENIDQSHEELGEEVSDLDNIEENYQVTINDIEIIAPPHEELGLTTQEEVSDLDNIEKNYQVTINDIEIIDEAHEELEFITQEEVCDLDNIQENYQVTINDIEIIDVSEIQDSDCSVNVPHENEAIITYENSSQLMSVINSDPSDCIQEMSNQTPSGNQPKDCNVNAEPLSSLTLDCHKKQSHGYKSRRENKRAALENHFLPKFINPIYLDSIKEENNEAIDKDKKNDFTELNTERNELDKNSHHILNRNVILEEIEPSNLEFDCVDVDEPILEMKCISLSPISGDVNTIAESNIIDDHCSDQKMADEILANDFNDTNKSINIISTTFIHPTQIEKLTINMPSHTTPSENKYLEKFIYPEPPATNEIEKPQNSLNVNCEIDSQKILNISEDVCADKMKNISNERIIQYSEKPDINSFFAKFENNESSELNLKKVKLEIENHSFINMNSREKKEVEDSINRKVNPIDIYKESCYSNVILDKQYEQQKSINPVTVLENKLQSSQAQNSTNDLSDLQKSKIKPLRLICTETLASMPYGEDVLEELAAVAISLNQLTQQHQNSNSLLCKNGITDTGCSINLLEPSQISENTDYNSSSSIKYPLTKTPQITKDLPDCNDILKQPLNSKLVTENIVSSTTLLPNLNDTENTLSNRNLFYNNDPKNNFKFLESVQDASQQSIDGNVLSKINTNITEKHVLTTHKNDLNSGEGQSSLGLSNTNTTKISLNKNDFDDFGKDSKSNERIVNVEVTNNPFCAQLMQTASKIYKDKDSLSNIDQKYTKNNKTFSYSNNKYDENPNNTFYKTNLEEKFNKIMSDIKLDTKYSEGLPKTPPRKESNQPFINRNENKTTHTDINTNGNNVCYDEFRKRAKETAKQRAKSEFFEREHFFKDFNRFSEIYDDDFFTQEAYEKISKDSKIVNIPIKLEVNETLPKPNSETDLKSSSQINKNESSPKVIHIPINVEKSNDTENSLKNEIKISEDLSEKLTKATYFKKDVKHLPDDSNRNEFWPRNSKIRAPRLYTSTTNLPFMTNLSTSSDLNSYQSYSRKKQHASCQSLIDETPISTFLTQKLSMPSLYNTDWHDKYINYMKNDTQNEFNKLENDRSKLIDEMNKVHEKRRLFDKEFRSNHSKTLSEEESFRQEMRDEWLNKIAEQEERRMHKTIKISKIISDDSSEIINRDNKKLNITDEFLKRVEERRSKLCMPSDSDWESGAESHPIPGNNDTINKDEVENNVKVIDGEKEKDLKNLPKHLVEFAEFVKKFEEDHLKECKELKGDYWSVDQKTEVESSEKEPPTPPPLPLWSPQPSPTLERKEFRPVKFESPTLPRRYVQLNSAPVAPPPWSYTDNKTEHKFHSTSETEKLKKQGDFIGTDKKHPCKVDTSDSVEPNEFTNYIKNDYMTVFETENDRTKNMAQLSRKKLNGVGPTTKDGIPISLRSEVDQNNQHQWYKTMFNTLHKIHDGDESVIIRYKCPRGRYLYKSKGYMSEPETNDSNYSTMKYTTKLAKRTTSIGGNADDDQIYGTMSNLSKYGSYRRPPGKIENFTPGQSSVSDKIKSQQWEQHKLSPSYTEGNLSRVLKEQGHESESNLVFRKRVESQSNPLSPVEQKQVYLNVQSGGEPPLNGFRKPAPEKPKEEKDFELQLASELTKHRHNKECVQKDKNHYSTHRTITTQNTVSFLPITKILIQPPTPPNRSSSRTRTSDSFNICFNTKKSTPSSERHRRCFDTDFLTKSSDKFKTISVRKNKYFDNLFRSQSGGAVNKMDSKNERKDEIQITGANKFYGRAGPTSPFMKATTRFTKRPQSLSPIAFGRSLSKERAFAVEKKRLEQSLPLCKESFAASTNILRDPSLKSPNEVKKAVQSFAHIHSAAKNKETLKKFSPTYSRSINSTPKLPCMRKKVTGCNRKDKLLKFSYSLVSRGIDIQNITPKTNKAVNKKFSTGTKIQAHQDHHKTNSTTSLTRTNSTFSVNSNESKTKHITKQNTNTYLTPKHKQNAKIQRTAGINSLIICPRKRETSESKKITNGMCKYNDLGVRYTDKEIKDEIVHQHESILSDNFFQNLFLRDVLPTLQSTSRLPRNFQEKAKFWNKFSAKSEPSLQRSNLYLSQNERRPSTTFLSCQAQKCQEFYNESQISDEEYHLNDCKKCEHRSRSEPRSQIYLSDNYSPNNVLQTTTRSLDNHLRPLSPTRSIPIPVFQKPRNLSSTESCNKRFSPTREIRIPVKKIQSTPPNLNLHESENRNQFVSPTLNISINSDTSLSNSLISHRKKLTKSFSPTREIRISQDSSHSYCPYTSIENRSTSPTYKKNVASQDKLSHEMDIVFNKESRRKSFSPTREIRICPDKSVPLQQTNLCHQRATKTRLISPNREEMSPIFDTTTFDIRKRKNQEGSRNVGTEIPQVTDLRSPSHRRIQSFRENKKCEKKSIIRASSLSSADDRQKHNLTYFSQPSLTKNYFEKQTQYNKDNKRHSNKFLDLNNFYSNIERFGQLEHATSATDLRAIRKQGKTVDYDEWKKIRAHKRAEKELSYVLRAIKQDEREKDFLFRPKELEEIKWTQSSDSGLRFREKSVEDLRENFEKTIKHDAPDKTKKKESYSNKDIYKPHWRTMTVADLTTNMQAKFNSEKTNVETEKNQQNDRSLGFSKKIISTLSKEQIHKIKNQLNEIYSSPITDESYKHTSKSETPSQQTHIIDSKKNSKNILFNSNVRHNKDDTIPYKSHAHITAKIDERKLHNSKSCDRIPVILEKKEHELNETEKKKLSKSLSQEIRTKGLELRKSRSNQAVISNQESKGVIDGTRPILERNISIIPSSSEIVSCYSEKLFEPTTLEESKDTVKENVNKKIKYFEEIKKEVPPKTIYHAREYSSPDEEEVFRKIDEKIKAKESQDHLSNILNHKQLSSSASDLKELFGEKDSVRTNYLGLRTTRPSEMTLNYITCLDSNNSFTHSDYNYGTTQCFENVYRSRSMSPIRERTYKKLWDNINTGSVKKIKNKFENINNNLTYKNDSLNYLRKVNSDPALNKQKKNDNKTTIKAYENSDVSCITYKFEPIRAQSRGRARYRKNLSPIPRVQIKKADLMMPHIDIISKTASLKHKLGKTPIHPKILRSGNVDRIRCKFDHCTLLSQIYTSSPDISELKDISSYLRGEWIAHKFPNKVDNDKTSVSLDDQPKYNRENDRTHRRPSSTSPLPNKTIVTSILKPYYNSFGHETFETLLNYPQSSYAVHNKQEQQHSTGVTFEENDIIPSTPPPPPKGVTFTDNGQHSESYFRCFEDIVNTSPIRYECKDIILDEELATQQRESLAKIYQKEREKKYVQELKNMNNRRHTDNFTPLQKLQIPLNRYDDFNADLPEPKKIPKTLVKALYNFTGESERELSFKKGDIMYIKRIVDTNWYEGEHNGQSGLLPANYIQIIPKNGVQSPQKKVSEGQGRAKFNFQAQSAVELSLNKGELVTLIRKVDENWFEGKIANRKGIFPVSYVEVLTDIGAEDLNKPFRSPTIQSKQNYQPSLDILRTTLNHEFNTLTNGHSPKELLREAKTQILHVDTESQPIAFRALYKYRPQNNDELELQESDIIYVLEMCDDGWYVGTSQRTGCFGTFPGNYVERV